MELWLNTLKPGDSVLISKPHKTPYPAIVDRITSTMIIVNCGKNGSGTTLYRRFRNTNGYAVGDDSFYTPSLEQATPERMLELKKQLIRNTVIHRIKNTNYHQLDDDSLAEINAVLTRS